MNFSPKYSIIRDLRRISIKQHCLQHSKSPTSFCKCGTVEPPSIVALSNRLIEPWSSWCLVGNGGMSENSNIHPITPIPAMHQYVVFRSVYPEIKGFPAHIPISGTCPTASVLHCSLCLLPLLHLLAVGYFQDSAFLQRHLAIEVPNGAQKML